MTIFVLDVLWEVSDFYGDSMYGFCLWNRFWYYASLEITWLPQLIWKLSNCMVLESKCQDLFPSKSCTVLFLVSLDMLATPRMRRFCYLFVVYQDCCSPFERVC